MTNLNEVMKFIQTASIEDRAAIRAMFDQPVSRREKAAATLAAIEEGTNVSFVYDRVDYKADVVKINNTTATVKITEINGTPRRTMFVGMVIRVSAGLLKR